MTHLTEALVRLENEWRTQDMPIVRLLRPGLTAQTITETLRAVGVRPHPEVIEWFSWHDGCTAHAEAVFQSRLLTLDQAVEQYVTHILAGEGSDQLYHPGWFPVADFTTGSLVVVSCNDYEQPTASTTEIDRELNLRPPEQRVASLAVPVEWWTRRFSSGLWHWDGQRIISQEDRASMPDEERRSGLLL